MNRRQFLFRASAIAAGAVAADQILAAQSLPEPMQAQDAFETVYTFHSSVIVEPRPVSPQAFVDFAERVLRDSAEGMKAHFDRKWLYDWRDSARARYAETPARDPVPATGTRQ